MNASLLDAYADRYRKRNDLYLAERDRFSKEMVETLGIDSILSTRTEPLVAVCGTTQVGKTTLILKLMGVSEEVQGDSSDLVKLAKALRGNKHLKPGEGGTPTAITYSWSGDDKFHLRTNLNPDIKVSTLSELEQKVQEVRNAMKAGKIQVSTDSWHHIRIPKRYAGKTPRDIALVDTPGKGVSNKEELTHLENIYRTLLPMANLVVFVERSSSIKELSEHELPGLGGLKEVAERCALVISHAFTENSMREAMKDADLTVEWIRNRISDEIKEEEFDWSPDNLFPLEYGTSWHNQMQNAPERAALEGPVIEEILKLLNEKIKKSQHPDEIVRQFLRIEKQIVTTYDRKLKREEGDLHKLERDRDRIRNQMKESCKDVKKKKRESAEIDSKVKLLESKINKARRWLQGIRLPKLELPKEPPSEEFTLRLESYRQKLAKYPREMLENELRDFLNPLIDHGIDIDLNDLEWFSDQVRKSMISPLEWKNWCDADASDTDGFLTRFTNWKLEERPSKAFKIKRKEALRSAAIMRRGNKHSEDLQFEGLLPFLERTLTKLLHNEIDRFNDKKKRIERKIERETEFKKTKMKELKVIESYLTQKVIGISELKKNKHEATGQARAIPERLVTAFNADKAKRMAALSNLTIPEQIAERIWIDASARRMKTFLNT